MAPKEQRVSVHGSRSLGITCELMRHERPESLASEALRGARTWVSQALQPSLRATRAGGS